MITAKRAIILFSARNVNVLVAALITALIALSMTPRHLGATEGTIPNLAYDESVVDTIISPVLSFGKDRTQQAVLNGYLHITGSNGDHEIWDISTPTNPQLITSFDSPHNSGEAEGHTLSFKRAVDNKLYAATISGRGVDIWNMTNPTQVRLSAAVEIEGVNYGDSSEAVWGVCWSGDYIFVGATNIGLVVIKASDPTNPSVVKVIEPIHTGLTKLGPVVAIGDILVVSTPKNIAGISTFDISDPENPTFLDSTGDLSVSSYIGWFYSTKAYLINPIRSYDVLSDPADIKATGLSFNNHFAEYLSFGDNHLFLGHKGKFGVTKYALQGETNLVQVGRPKTTHTDDQFSIPIGNLIIISNDDGRGSMLLPHQAARDTTGPEIIASRPLPGTLNYSTKAGIGLSLSDQIDATMIDRSGISLTPLAGGDAVDLNFSTWQTFLNIVPHQALADDTSYRLTIAADAITDLVGNPMPESLDLIFSTGNSLTLPPTCEVTSQDPALTNTTVTWTAADAGNGATYRWDFGDGSSSQGSNRSVSHTFTTPGRYTVRLTVETDQGQASCTVLQIVYNAPTAQQPHSSSNIFGAR